MPKLPLSKLKLNPKNPRFIRDEKFEKLKKSLKDFPEMMEARPIVIDENNMILGGNMRFRAAKEHWMAKVWDDNVIKFAENIIDIMPDIPTVYFNKMTGFLENDDVQLFATENMQNCIRFIEENTNKKITDYRIMNVKKTVCKELPEEIINEIKKNNSRTYELIELLKQ